MLPPISIKVFIPRKYYKFPCSKVLTYIEGGLYDMDAYMATLFGGEAWELCWGLGQAENLDSTLNRSPASVFT